MSMVTAAGLAELDLSDLDLWADGPPHAVFERLRREEPLHFSELRGFDHERGFWSAVRYEDIAAIGRDHEAFSSERGGILAVDRVMADPPPGVPDALDIMRKMMICMDPPRHDRLKALVQRAFTPKRAQDHADRIREIINLVYDRALEAHPDGRFDLVQDVGVYIPAMVIGDLLGVPREDADQLVDWTNRTTAFEDPRLVPDPMEGFAALMEAFVYVSGLVEERRARPQDDLLTALVQAEVDGERLEHEEVLMFWFMLMVAGNDSTRATFTSGMKHVLEDPEQERLLRAGEAPLDHAVEEFLRMHPAFPYMRRTATREVELHGRTIAEGDKVLLWYVSGNRDESVFADPHRFDLRRDPNPHQAFGGGGRHFCLGSGLARLELRIWLEETLRRFPRLELAGAADRVSSTFLNQYRSIPVAAG